MKKIYYAVVLFFFYFSPLLWSGIDGDAFAQNPLVKQWDKRFGGTGYDWVNFFQQTNDGGYIVTGSSDSNDGDVTGNHGSDDVWVVKFGDITGMKEQHPSAFRAYPSPSEGIFYLNTKGMSLHAVLTVQTCLGETVLQHSIDSETTRVDLSGYAAGIYFFAINDEKQKWTGKLVKE